MSEVVSLPNIAQIKDEASVWLARIDRGLSASEQQAFSRWLLTDQKHEHAFSEMARLWDNMDALNQLAEIFPKEQSESPKEKKKQRLAMFYRYAPLTFSVVALIIFVNVVMLVSSRNIFTSDPLFEGHFVTAVGEQSRLNLNDGSVLTLNTNSRVEVLFSREERILNLKHGELHIDVAHDSSRPLSVIAGGKIVQAVGTAFNVQLGLGDVEVIVTEGKVLVADSKSHEESGRKYVVPNAQAVQKGELALFAEQANTVSSMAEEDMQNSLSWRQGKIIFRGESLASAIDEISRYTALEFSIVDPELAAIQIAGRFKTGDLSGMLFALEENFGIHSVQRGNHILLSRDE